MNPTVSILIRVRDGEKFLPQCLKALKVQDYSPFEIVVVDNESIDESLSIAIRANARVVTIPRDEFTYGKALNLGMRASTGEIVILLSAHSLVVGPNFLREVVKAFENPRVAAARCLHVMNRREVENWAEPDRVEWPADIEAVIARGPVASGCAIRKSVWAEIPFDERLRGVEDKFWAYKALQENYLIVSTPATYLYLLELPVRALVHKLARDRAVFFQETGRYFSDSPGLLDVLKSLCYTLPRRMLRHAMQSILLYVELKLIPLRFGRSGSMAQTATPKKRSSETP